MVSQTAQIAEFGVLLVHMTVIGVPKKIVKNQIHVKLCKCSNAVTNQSIEK